MNENNKYNIKFSIRDKLLLWFITISSAILVIMILISYHEGRNIEIEAIKKNLYNDAKDMIEGVDQALYEAYSDTNIWAGLDIPQRSLEDNDPKYFKEYANTIISNKHQYDLLILTDKNGKLFASNTITSDDTEVDIEILKDLDLSSEAWFKKSIDRKNTAVHITDVHKPNFIKKGLKKDIYVVAFSMTVRDILDEPIGVWTTYFTVNNLYKVMNNFIKKDQEGYLIGYPILINKAGDVICSLSPFHNNINPLDINLLAAGLKSVSMVINGTDDAIEEEGINRIRQIIGFASSKGMRDYKGLGWAMMNINNADDALQPVRDLRLRLIIIGIAVAFLVGIVIILLSKGMSEPLLILVDAVKKLSSGELSTRVDIKSNDEIGVLAYSFNKMAGDLKESYNRIEDYSKQLEYKVTQRTSQLTKSNHSTLVSLAHMAEVRDYETGEHLIRIAQYCKVIASAIGDKKFVEDIEKASPIHDIGKVGIPDNILLKPDKLTDLEFEIIKSHTILGGKILEQACTEGALPVMVMAKDIAYYHHEKFDGSGYPKGLKGEEIPLSARITAVADCYDVITSDRIYKKAMSHDKAFSLIIKDSGTHFDPSIVNIFVSKEAEIIQILEEFKMKKHNEAENVDIAYIQHEKRLKLIKK